MPHDLLLRFNQRVIVHGLRDCLSPETLDVQICKASCLDNNTKTQTRHFQLSEPSESKPCLEFFWSFFVKLNVTYVKFNTNFCVRKYCTYMHT